jgi:hypothetical protein
MASIVATGVAGCSGGDSSGGPATEGSTVTATATETTASSTATETQTDTPASLPPGTSDAGIDDASVLIKATQTALRNNSYDVTTSLTSGDPDRTITQRLVSDLDTERSLLVFDAPSETNRLYVDSDTMYQQSGSSDVQTTAFDQSFQEYHRSQDIVRMLDGTEALGGILQVGTFEPTGTTDVRGRSVTSFEVASVTFQNEDAEVDSTRGTLLVGPDGVVYEARLRIEYTTPEGGRVYGNMFVINQLEAVSLPQPSWVPSE